MGAKAQEIDETGSSTGDKNIQVREVVIERPLKEGNPEDPVNNSNTKSCNEDSTSRRTTAKPVNDFKGDEETISSGSPHRNIFVPVVINFSV